MAYLCNYSFDFLFKGHNQQLYTKRKTFDSNFSLVVICIKIQTLPRNEFFYFVNLCLYSVSCFSVTIRLITSSKVATEILKLLQ